MMYLISTAVAVNLVSLPADTRTYSSNSTQSPAEQGFFVIIIAGIKI
jgi:hypothetical protein